jgi:hypothetical protein
VGLFRCRKCLKDECSGECQPSVVRVAPPSPAAASDRFMTPAGQARLSRAQEALKAAATEIGREELLRDRKRQGLCANGQTRLAHRNSMRIYMRKYRARKRAEQTATAAGRLDIN